MVASKHIAEDEVVLRCRPERVSLEAGLGYEDVVTICDALPTTFLSTGCYWAALSCLTAEQLGKAQLNLGIEAPLSHERQALWLSLLTVLPRVSWRAPGIQRPAGDGAAEPAPGAGLREDLAVESMLRHFGMAAELAPLLLRLALSWRCNSFQLAPNRIGVFLLPALCNHSCWPSLRYSFEAGADGETELVLTAFRPLAPGEAMTVSYIDCFKFGSVKSRVERRVQVAIGWYFYCLCEICQQFDEEERRCGGCGAELAVWISHVDSGPYGIAEGPTCDKCGVEDLITAGPYFLHCACCELDLCPLCAEGCAAASDGTDDAREVLAT